MGEFFIRKKGEQLGVVELVFKIILVRYPNGGLVEDFPWEYHGLWRAIIGAIAYKRYDIARYGVRSSYGVGPNYKGV